MSIENLFKIERELKKSVFEYLDEIEFYNQKKVLRAFSDCGVADYHLKGSTGYGHDDIGRDTLEKVYANIFNTEKALVRPHFASGTHAIAVALYGVLRPNDEMLSITGKPYDTLEEVLGLRGENQGSLKDWGINYKQLDLLNDGVIDFDNIITNISEKTKIIYIQRSRGYEWRKPIPVSDIEKVCKIVKGYNKKLLVVVDNCYGEFVEKLEPTDVGVDIAIGSLIKNPGGGLALCGSYIVGKEDLVNQASYRLYAPGIGCDGGATLDFLRSTFQGLFLAPHVVNQALKGAVLTSKVFSDLGFDVSPKFDDNRTDLIQSIKFNDEELLKTFCKAIQSASPVDSYVTPIPDEVPGYSDKVIMAAGNFIEGSSIELSADGPLREPYIAYLQGGLTYSHCKIALLKSIEQLNLSF